ncbi:unnamed protein product, partial [Nesidiocoris tenuis]
MSIVSASCSAVDRWKWKGRTRPNIRRRTRTETGERTKVRRLRVSLEDTTEQ